MVRRFFERTFRPATMALALAALFLGMTWLTSDRIAGPFDNVVGGGALAASAVLFLSWYFDSHRARRAGLLLSVALWSAISSVAFMNLSAWTSGLLALAWAFLAGGSYWIEAANKEAT